MSDDPGPRDDFFVRLQQKWQHVPFSPDGRRSTAELLAMDDVAFDEAWEHERRTTSEGVDGFRLRGWYHLLYRDW